VQKKRPDLRIIISSATMDAQLFKNFFEMYNPNKRKRQKSKFLSRNNTSQDNTSSTSSSSSSGDGKGQGQVEEVEVDNSPSRDTAVICSITGRCHSVDMHYLSTPCFDYIKCAAETVISIHNKCDLGDVLVFLPGMEEVEYYCMHTHINIMSVLVIVTREM
jgi:ATP-dependent RNA helicase DDX35